MRPAKKSFSLQRNAPLSAFSFLSGQGQQVSIERRSTPSELILSAITSHGEAIVRCWKVQLHRSPFSEVFSNATFRARFCTWAAMIRKWPRFAPAQAWKPSTNSIDCSGYSMKKRKRLRNCERNYRIRSIQILNYHPIGDSGPNANGDWHAFE
jgi:hypothetical protein